MYNSTLITLRGSSGTGTARIVTANGQSELSITLRQPWPGSECRAYLVSDNNEVPMDIKAQANAKTLKGSCTYNDTVTALLLCLPREMKFLLEGTSAVYNHKKSLESIKARLRIAHMAAVEPERRPAPQDSLYADVPAHHEEQIQEENKHEYQVQQAETARIIADENAADAACETYVPAYDDFIEFEQVSDQNAPVCEISGATDAPEQADTNEDAHSEHEADAENAKPPAKSAALESILARAKTIFSDSTTQTEPQASAHEPLRASQARDLSPNRPTPMQRSDKGWDEQVSHMLNAAPKVADEPKKISGVAQDLPIFNPFPDAFPRSTWKRKYYPGTNRFYLEGEALKDNSRFLIHALPGEYSPVPPMRNRGFSKFMRATDGSGYWLRIRKMN